MLLFYSFMFGNLSKGFKNGLYIEIRDIILFANFKIRYIGKT